MGFREVDVEDYPIEARIHIQKDISAGFPIMEALAKMQSLNDQISNLRNPHGFKDLMRLHQEQLRLQKKDRTRGSYRGAEAVFIAAEPPKVSGLPIYR